MAQGMKYPDEFAYWTFKHLKTKQTGFRLKNVIDCYGNPVLADFETMNEAFNFWNTNIKPLINHGKIRIN